MTIENSLMPSYMRKFECIGGACEDTCCSGWSITLDKKSYKSYKKTKSKDLKSRMQGKIEKTPEFLHSDRSYAYFKMDENERCPMITTGGLCSIQLELGEQALSPTCSTYPRKINRINEQLEMSASLSCPEVARLALLNENGIEFDEVEFDMSSNWAISQQMNTHDTLTNQHLFWPIRMFSIEIVQNRRVELPDRLVALGLFIARIQQELAAGNVHDIEHIIHEYRMKMNNTQYLEAIHNIDVSIELQVKVLLGILQNRFNYGTVGKRYEQVLSELKEGYAIDEIGNEISEVVEVYKHNYLNYYYPFINEHEYILENYVVNAIFKNVFPSDMNQVFQEYTTLMVNYAMIKVHLVGVAGYNKRLDYEIIIKTIQALVKTTEHHSHYLEGVLTMLDANKFNTMAHISTLIKDMK
ncbi:flagellin lysine-N-methylase [Paenibacillus sp. SC116]|uniref:flagellin lysine-N-methylase n=1 Tax=Paenibacillus sp. SC116 TaxID=2968986 RepID=UPI00215B2A51|nr:flagellin lysine-N-methylase [Paenibacillus sp. SC116]MCR8844815.1 flagellin lysine-N-methylase [Paenibacillus sp. SC116]